MRDDILIWWTSEIDCRVIGEPHDQTDPDDATEGDPDGIHDTSRSPLPAYLVTEYGSRYGRHGRGRLWVPDGIPWAAGRDGIDPWPETQIARMIDRYGHAGIVFHRSDLPIVAAMPGFVTDMALRLVLPEREQP